MVIDVVYIMFSAADGLCALIPIESRDACDNLSDELLITKTECEASGCCWDQLANSSALACYQKGDTCFIYLLPDVFELVDHRCGLFKIVIFFFDGSQANCDRWV